MKRIKLFLAAATFCAATAVGYNVYINATMTEEERLVQANLEALTNSETTIGGIPVWQTMGYCHGQIELVCSYLEYAYDCSHANCVGNY